MVYSIQATNKANLPFYLSIESNGSLTLFNSLGTSLWNTNTISTNTRLVMQDDGNLVLADGNNQVYWASNSKTNTNSLIVTYIF